jgi:multidrug resistance efflux pump
MADPTFKTPEAESITIQSPDLAAQLEEANAKLAAANQRNGELTAQNESFKAAKEQISSDEQIIFYKISLGLSREQSINVIRRQREMHRLDPGRYLSVEAAHLHCVANTHRLLG